MFVWKLDLCMETICLYVNYVCMETICLYGNYVCLETMFVWKLYVCMETIYLLRNYIFVWKLDVCMETKCLYGGYMFVCYVWKLNIYLYGRIIRLNWLLLPMNATPQGYCKVLSHVKLHLHFPAMFIICYHVS